MGTASVGRSRHLFLASFAPRRERTATDMGALSRLRFRLRLGLRLLRLRLRRRRPCSGARSSRGEPAARSTVIEVVRTKSAKRFAQYYERSGLFADAYSPARLSSDQDLHAHAKAARMARRPLLS